MIRRLNKKSKNELPIDQLIGWADKKPARRLKPGLWSANELVPGFIYDIYELNDETRRWDLKDKVQIVELKEFYAVALYFRDNQAQFKELHYYKFGLIKEKDSTIECTEYDMRTKLIIKFAGSINYKIFQGGYYVG